MRAQKSNTPSASLTLSNQKACTRKVCDHFFIRGVRKIFNLRGGIAWAKIFNTSQTSASSRKDDECYFAMCYPYTYTDVQRHVRELVNCPQKNRLFTRHEFCRTASGNVLDLLVISGGSKDVNLRGFGLRTQKKYE